MKSIPTFMPNKFNVSLVVALLIPVAMVVFIGLSIYLPTLLLKPKHDFVYSTGGSGYLTSYVVKDGIITTTPPQFEQTPNYYYNDTPAKLYIHNISENKSRVLSFENAAKLQLDPSSISEDGFSVVHGSDSYGFFPLFFSGSYEDSYYLKKDSFSKKLNLNVSSDYYYDYKFLGWVK